jgi:hypothetical protein
VPSQVDKNISHAWVEERLSAYIDNQLDTLERAQTERHLRDCVSCRASLSSLQWTISLVKQAPAPALSRSFTLPVPKESKRASAPASAFNLGFAARWATVVATLFLFALVGVDVITQFGGTSSRSAAVPAAEFKVEPTTVAFGQPSTATSVARDAAPVPAASSSAASSIAPALAPAPATAKAPAGAAPAALPPAAPTLRAPSPQTGLGPGGQEASATTDGSKAITTTTAAKASAANAVITPTALPTTPPTETVAPASTAAPAPSPTAPLVAQAKSEPTHAPAPSSNETTRATEITNVTSVISPWRVAEIGLLFLTVFFGALVILMRRK